MPVTLKSRLPAIVQALPARAEQATREGAELVAEATRQRAPVSDDAPHIKDRISVREADSGLHAFSGGQGVSGDVLVQHGYWVVIGDDDTYYGHMIEYGTVKTPAHPFAVPAKEASENAVEGLVAASLRGL